MNGRFSFEHGALLAGVMAALVLLGSFHSVVAGAVERHATHPRGNLAAAVDTIRTNSSE